MSSRYQRIPRQGSPSLSIASIVHVRWCSSTPRWSGALSCVVCSLPLNERAMSLHHAPPTHDALRSAWETSSLAKELEEWERGVQAPSLSFPGASHER